MTTPLRMNSALGKRILALARQGDYAHAGEEEAIHLTLDPVPKRAEQTLLDIGCGRGGTARYVQDHGWGRVTGFDIEGESVRQAQERHPDLRFLVSDVAAAAQNVPGLFDVLYSFNAFYAFPDQAVALQAVRQKAKTYAPLLIFDYVDRGGFAETIFARSPEAAHWKPLHLDTLAEFLAANGWKLEEVKPVHAEYERWYTALVARFDARRADIVTIADEATFTYARNVYAQLLDAVKQGRLGGAIARARVA